MIDLSVGLELKKSEIMSKRRDTASGFCMQMDQGKSRAGRREIPCVHTRFSETPTTKKRPMIFLEKFKRISNNTYETY